MDMMQNLSPQRVLQINRVIWTALLLGLLTIATVLVGIGLFIFGEPIIDDTASRTLLLIVFSVTAMGMCLFGWFYRAATWRKSLKQHNTLSAQAYTTGNISLWGAIEGAGINVLVGYLMTLSPAMLALAVILIAVLAFNFPTVKGLELAT